MASLFLSWFFIATYIANDDYSLEVARRSAFRAYVSQENTKFGFDDVWDKRTTAPDPDYASMGYRTARIDVYHETADNEENIAPQESAANESMELFHLEL